MKKNLLFLLLTLSYISNAQDKGKRLDAVFTNLYQKGEFNGNVLIAEKGNVIFKKSYGFANEATKELLNENSIFELASCSKQFTAIAIAILHKQNKLDFDDDIATFIPELSFYEGISVRNLVNHTSGLPDYMELFDSYWKKTKIANNDDLIALYKKHKPKITFRPNSKYEYSNTGYALLATIIERVSKISYDDFLLENIFKPLGMTNSFVYTRRYKPAKVKNYAYGYVYDNKNVKILPDNFDDSKEVYFLDGIKGDGTVNSTVNDLLIWDRALYSFKLLNKKETQELFMPTVLNNKKLSYYGFGWEIEEGEDLGKIVSHDGEWFGYISYIERQLDKDRTIIILQNTEKGELPTDKIRNILGK